MAILLQLSSFYIQIPDLQMPWMLPHIVPLFRYDNHFSRTVFKTMLSFTTMCWSSCGGVDIIEIIDIAILATTHEHIWHSDPCQLKRGIQRKGCLQGIEDLLV